MKKDPDTLSVVRVEPGGNEVFRLVFRWPPCEKARPSKSTFLRPAAAPPLPPSTGPAPRGSVPVSVCVEHRVYYLRKHCFALSQVKGKGMAVARSENLACYRQAARIG